MAKWQDDPRDLDRGVLAKGETFRGTSGNDHLVGTDFPDIFRIGQGGDDRIEAGKRGDTIYAGASLTGADRIDGGAGNDTLVLNGDYSDGLALEPRTLSRVEFLNLEGGFAYSLTLPPDMRHDQASFTIDARHAGSLHLDASSMDFELGVRGSAGDDVIIGNDVENLIAPGGGHDVMTGGAGFDLYGFLSTSDSLPSNGDLITNFDDSKDLISLLDIDADPRKAGHQDFHLGATSHHVGDVTLVYDADRNVTLVDVFTHDSPNPDMVIQLTGDHTDLTTANFSGVDASASVAAHLDPLAHLDALTHHLPIA